MPAHRLQLAGLVANGWSGYVVPDRVLQPVNAAAEPREQQAVGRCLHTFSSSPARSVRRLEAPPSSGVRPDRAFLPDCSTGVTSSARPSSDLPSVTWGVIACTKSHHRSPVASCSRIKAAYT